MFKSDCYTVKKGYFIEIVMELIMATRLHFSVYYRNIQVTSRKKKLTKIYVIFSLKTVNCFGVPANNTVHVKSYFFYSVSAKWARSCYTGKTHISFISSFIFCLFILHVIFSLLPLQPGLTSNKYIKAFTFNF